MSIMFPMSLVRKVIGSRLSYSLQSRQVSNFIVVRLLPVNTIEDAFRKQMEVYGPVPRLVLKPLNLGKWSYAIVEFKDPENAFAAIDDLNGSVLYGRRIFAEFDKFNGTLLAQHIKNDRIASKPPLKKALKDENNDNPKAPNVAKAVSAVAKNKTKAAFQRMPISDGAVLKTVETTNSAHTNSSDVDSESDSSDSDDSESEDQTK